jgi:DNA-binding transcriptional LysR family regulator
MRVVVALVELRSVRAAADALSMSPSAVSKHLRRIEELVGRTLFMRTRQGVEPNREGRDLAELGRRFLALVDEVGERFDREMVRGRVRLGVTDDVGLTKLPDVINLCAARHPGLEVELMVDFNSVLVAAFEAQLLDLALLSDGSAPLPVGAVPLRPEPMLWIGRPGIATPAQPIPLVVSTDECRWRARAIEALQKAGIKYCIRCVSPSAAGQISAVRSGLGIAPLPASVFAQSQDVGPITRGLPLLPHSEPSLAAQPRLSRAAQAMRDALREAYGAP